MSEVVKEVITDGIDYWSPPLKKHRYSMSSVERRVFESNGTPSGLLMEYIQERERAYSGLLEEKSDIPEAMQPLKEDVQAFSSFLEEVESDGSHVEGNETDIEDPKPKRKFRSLKKIEKIIYDDSAVKLGELEDEAYDLLNEDGFYDEVLPIDFEDEDGREMKRIPIKTIALYVGMLGFVVVFVIIALKILVL